MQKQSSFAKEFLVITWLMIGAAIGGFAWYAFHLYTTKSDAIYHDLNHQAARIERTLQEVLNYTDHQMHYLSMQISNYEQMQQHGGHQGGGQGERNFLKFINQLFASFRLDLKEYDHLPWRSLSWVTPDNLLVVSNERGILPQPRLLADEDGFYDRTRRITDTVFLGKQTTGKMNGDVAIKAGRSILSIDEKILGTVVVSLRLRSFAQRLESAITDGNVYYAVFDEDDNILMESADEEVRKHEVIREKLAILKKEKTFRVTETSDRPGFFSLQTLAHYTKIPGPNYILVTMYDPTVSKTLMKELLWERLIELVIVCGVLLLSLWMLKNRILNPLTCLSAHAKLIAQGGNSLAIPVTNIEEIECLAQHLREVIAMRSTVSIALHDRDHAQHARVVADISKNAAETECRKKSVLLANVAKELQSNTSNIINHSEFLANNSYPSSPSPHSPAYMCKEEEDRNKWLALAENIQFLSVTKRNLASFSDQQNTALTLNETTFDIGELLAHVIALNQAYARFYFVQISMKTDPDLPLLLGDKIHIAQMLYNLLHTSIHYSTEFSELHVSVLLSAEAELAVKIERRAAQLSTSYDFIPRFPSPGARNQHSQELSLLVAHAYAQAHQSHIHIYRGSPTQNPYLTISFPKARMVSAEGVRG